MSNAGHARITQRFNDLYKQQHPIQAKCVGRPLYSGQPSIVPDALREVQLVNIGSDPRNTHYDAPNATRPERELIKQVMNWMGCSWFGDTEEKFGGFVTSGGSASNLYALQNGRDRFDSDELPYVLLTKAAHYSNKGALKTLGLSKRIVEVAVLDDDSMDMGDLEAKLKGLTEGSNVILVLTCGTTMRGGIDNLTKAKEALKAADFSQDRFYVHLDAALMGPVLMFASDVPVEYRPNFSDHSMLGSICFSGHKWPGMPDCCGVLVWNKEFVSGDAAGEVEYTKSDNRAGSRSGALALDLYGWVFGYEREFRQQQADRCLKMAADFCKLLNKAGIPARCNPFSITVWFPRPDNDFGYSLVFEEGDAHIIVMPQITQELLDEVAGKYLVWWLKNKVVG